MSDNFTRDRFGWLKAAEASEREFLAKWARAAA